ncbi:MAG: tRNA uridine-5-carboxymethylaminomethyl(34) synthesis GTPase MnmE [Candidatus Omnitrophica bacterium]|jgi:tRNA modification GTPase|nr:tRNA uridine-5-carboxymethylaminomethyl(34) synthesis GTPase MnmE [Candidatus Omnitrophota bacterium]
MSLIKLKDYNTNDTIVAIATFPSKSALGVVKISGKKAISIIHKIFIPRRKKDIRNAKTYTLHYGWIVSHSAKHMAHSVKNKTSHVSRPTSQVAIDEVLVSIMRKPCSYTCEDVVEISSHGGTVALSKILDVILKEGARLARPGEFTYRAFLNGRIDLLQAEGIRNIVEAKTDKALQTAVSQLKGESFEKFNKVKQAIKDVFLSTEVDINFPEDNTTIEFNNIKNKIKKIDANIKDILEADKKSKVAKDGLRCVICGKTNAGKSTLFNCLLQEERVIVSEIPGTTRDTIEETINVKGIPLCIYDTAGILTPRNFIEKKALEKSSKVFNEADLIMLVLDGSRHLEKDDLFLLNKIENLHNKKNNNAADNVKGIIIIINKSDLKQKLNLKNVSRLKGFRVKLSALKKEGIEHLEEAIVKVAAQFGSKREDLVFLNKYQSEILKDVYKDIQEAQIYLSQGREVDLVNLSLKNALDNLGKLTGEVFCEELLENIFSQFCIGK